MALLYLIQSIVALFVFYQVSRMVNIFGEGRFDGEKRFDTNQKAHLLHVSNPPPLMQQAIDKINSILVNRQRNKFYVSSYTVEDVVDGLATSAAIRVRGFISIHIMVALVSMAVTFGGYAFYNQLTSGLFEFSMEPGSVVALAAHNQNYWFLLFYVFLFTFLLMSIEYIYWLFSRNKINERRMELMSFIDREFQDNMMDDMRLVLSQFSDIQREMNSGLQKNNAQLTENVSKLNKIVEQQTEYIKTYSGYIASLREIKVEDLVVDTVKLQSEINSSLKKAGEYYPQFASLSKTLNETLNRTITLYGQLNDAINRDAQFKTGIEVYNDSVKYNGHITAKLLETLNNVQAHINQVVMTYGPKIEELDKEFFKYMENRLIKLKDALEKNDELMVKHLNEITKSKIRKLKDEK